MRNGRKRDADGQYHAIRTRLGSRSGLAPAHSATLGTGEPPDSIPVSDPVIPSGGISSVTLLKTFHVVEPPLGDSTWNGFIAPVDGVITRLRSIMVGLGSGYVNALVGGSGITSNQALATTWTSSAVLAYAMASGVAVNFALRSIAGSVADVVIQIDYRESA